MANDDADFALIREALQEFISVRTPVRDYVAMRYATHDQEFRDRKLVSVQERVERAQALLENGLSICGPMPGNYLTVRFIGVYPSHESIRAAKEAEGPW